MTNNLDISTRKYERKKTRIFGTVIYFNEQVKARVLDLSETGMALELQRPLNVARGSRVKIESDDLGYIEGIVQWNHMDRIGLKLNLSSNTLAQLSSYFRFFHEDIQPVLRR